MKSESQLEEPNEGKRVSRDRVCLEDGKDKLNGWNSTRSQRVLNTKLRQNWILRIKESGDFLTEKTTKLSVIIQEK